MRKIDHIAIEIYSELLGEYEKNIKQNGHYLNIFGIFMHEIMIYLTNYTQIKYSKYEYDYELDFPFLNSRYVECPFQVDHIEKSTVSVVSTKRSLAKIFFLLFRFGKKCAYNNHISSEALKFSISQVFQIQMENIDSFRCFLPNKEDQYSKLKQFFSKFCDSNKVVNSEIFCNNFISYVEQFVQNKQPVIESEYFISSCNYILSNRIAAAHFLECEKNVIAFAHGEQDAFILDDPCAGYGDMSYCTHFITYGSAELTYGKYNHPLKGHSPKIVRRASKIIKSFYKSDVIKQQNIRAQGLYIANGFNINYKWGPFQHHDDELYMLWQQALYDVNSNLVYKKHIATRGKYIPDKASHVIHENLNKLNLDNYGYIVIDFISTAMAIASASNVPIIYFHLGLINLNDEALSDLRERVFWVDIDFEEDIESQIVTGFNNFFQVQENIINNIV